MTWQKPVPHSISNRLEDTKAEKYGLNICELVLRLPEKKKTKLEPKWEGPFIIDQVLTCGAYRLRDASNNRLEPNPWNASTGQNLVNNEGTFPFGLELGLFLLWQA